MTEVLLMWLALMTWICRDWGPIDPSEKAVALTTWIFRTPSLDKKMSEWLGEK